MESEPDSECRDGRLAGLCLRGQSDGERYELALKRGRNRIGSLPENDIVLSVAGISRQHAVIDWDGDGIWVEDLDSKNGTLVNGARAHRAPIQVGDAICLGPVPLLLEAMDADDGIAAIVMPATAVPAADATRRQAQRTPTQHNELTPASWLGALARLGEITEDGDSNALPVALDIVRSATGARAAVLLTMSSGMLAVKHSIGDVDMSAGFDAAASDVVALLEAREDADDVLYHRVPGGSDSHVALRKTGRGEPLALLVQGDFPAAASCGPFLTAALRLIARHDSAHPAPRRSPALRRPVPELAFPPDHVPGRTPAMLGLYHQLHHLVAGDLPLLITGETGVGKEHVARIVHLASSRRTGPFVAVNCAAIPTDLLEAELFGIEKGIATGVEAREGKMQLARGGLVFLDEVGDMSPALQAKLLRALQEREVHPVGARRPVPLDVRIVSATNTDLAERIVEGRFRHDLYFRLAGYTLHVPPLRDRRGDIPTLVEQFMSRHSAAIGKKIRGISRKALQALVHAPWPGNVRELENEVRRLVYLCHDGDLVTSALLSPPLQAAASETPAGPAITADDLHLATQVEALERRLVALALEQSKGKVPAAARLLGLSRYGLTLKMRRLGISTDEQGP